ncbi:hypothetical protein GCM10022243_13020 [Saccharothrix violaceirubra]|uniref:DUF3040 family protein n=1 Tax=Saccharothrix violaceirubra TaxID=413306 RepID=A0A7W7T741_9PSEU|nr:DUF3040 domain-containing protein [Saccharothrix violaceirubra]MBB4967541.1 hypothetical protein [Saccharothrix violaceirubra]
MLSESERRTLIEIETRLTDEEPALATALVAGKPKHPVLVYSLAAVFVALGVLLLLLGSFGPALASLGSASAILLLRGFTWR